MKILELAGWLHYRHNKCSVCFQIVNLAAISEQKNCLQGGLFHLQMHLFVVPPCDGSRIFMTFWLQGAIQPFSLQMLTTQAVKCMTHGSGCRLDKMKSLRNQAELGKSSVSISAVVNVVTVQWSLRLLAHSFQFRKSFDKTFWGEKKQLVSVQVQ